MYHERRDLKCNREFYAFLFVILIINYSTFAEYINTKFILIIILNCICMYVIYNVYYYIIFDIINIDYGLIKLAYFMNSYFFIAVRIYSCVCYFFVI